MTLRYKFILFAIIPLLLSFFGIATAVFYQSTQLAQQQRHSVEQAYLASKELELKHYVKLAKSAIAHLYEHDHGTPRNQEEAKKILASLDFGDDGYFYIYDRQGNNLMHPRQPELVGRNLWNMTDPQGQLTIQKLIHAADQGGGAVRYLWEKPSSHQMAAKLGYVIPLERWGWVLGSGIYLDDVESALTRIDVQGAANIHNTMFWIVGITLACALAIAAAGLALNISQSRLADAKLKVLTRRIVSSQEDERARLSRDLHDGLSQLLVSVKLQIESGVAKLAPVQPAQEAARIALARATKQLNEALAEVRRISHDLRPAMLVDLGVVAAFEHLAAEFENATALPVLLVTEGKFHGLSEISGTVLYRVAQEALTNIHKHAKQVSQVEIELRAHGNTVTLCIIDNGSGFDAQGIAEHPKRGIGLSNMRERLATVQGQLLLQSNSKGTRVVASIPHGE
ncbi:MULTISPECIES: cache domain-containing protein [unclassified Undibacterium]|uniref:cache domain-containing protein n=1 Tax=unclassified Undibacterium TaxID=2630295 RepID=UPI002AC9EBB4|nr:MULTISPECIES: cache domain-containing protein [unclassified Undibacterium]MEB0140987.1 cache domain-containing protein [Undibacterium sp. CCC2.1]MEB0173455.1 cache domain-containing protein [Undibacterium sp. CCC1.1]MEB0177189.1 cache domain-containing protein [Undibacterium sp. CCC3.4]MEB0216454.1 cache domain-containing protein [Undibacterium sp. 5I2]WPX42050.1 cache domain-containing protein [Undibacterium sp. CCC3.4]